MNVEVRELRAEDVPRIAETYGGAAWHGGAKKWDQRLVEHAHGQRLVLLVVDGTDVLGYGSLLWVSGHAPFREAHIPEINDLVVSERCRNQGIATKLIHALEERARGRNARRSAWGLGCSRSMAQRSGSTFTWDMFRTEKEWLLVACR